MKKLLLFLIPLFLFACNRAPRCEYVANWSDADNARICAFLESTRTNHGRKIAVFDIDGTLFGQVPFYLADEAIFMDAAKYDYYEDDELDKNVAEISIRQAVANKMVAAKDHGTADYVKMRIEYLSGMTPAECEGVGEMAFTEKFYNKSFPQMKTVIHNLQSYNIEVWGLTASPECLYRGFISHEFNIPRDHVLGLRGKLVDGMITNEIDGAISMGVGKAETIENRIGATPMIVAGNSMGDFEMIQKSVGLKIIVNPSPEFREKFDGDAAAIIVTVPDTDNGEDYLSREFGIKSN